MLVKLFISEIVHTEDSFLLKLYYKFNFATEPVNGLEEFHFTEQARKTVQNKKIYF
ncbi:hypothetical protein ACUXJ3_002487 [Staphylococcus capitis]